MLKYLIVVLLCFSSSVSSTTLADILVISNLDFPAQSLSTTELRKVWLGKSKKISNVGRIVIRDQVKHKRITQQFYLHITKKNPNQVRAYWAKMKFIGKGFPPKQLNNDIDVINWVRNTHNSIGYIDKKSLTNNIKILKTIIENQK